MKILVIFTGGTIGSTVKGDWISTDSSTNYILLDRYRSESGDNVTQFDVLTPCTMLSENLTNTELNLIIESVCSNIKKDYDGIIVTHGTDTIQYTAAALSYAVSGTEVPVMIVSSDYPLSDSRANGVKNFVAAVEFIKAKAGAGVYAAYKNADEENVAFYNGTSIALHGECSANLYSIGSAYAYYDGAVKKNSGYKAKTTDAGVGAVKYVENPKILTINSMPCDSFTYPLENVEAVIIRPYHSGTLNTANTRLAEFCQRAGEKNIPIFLVNAVSGKNYESVKLFDSIGLTVLPNSAYASVFMKCWLAISMNENIKEFVKKEYGVQ